MLTIEDLINVIPVLCRIRQCSSTKDKVSILTKYSNENVKAVLKYAYDKVTYSYGISGHSIRQQLTQECGTSDNISELLDKLNKRELVGNDACKQARLMCNRLNYEYQEVFCQIFDRDLKLGLNVKSLNKIFKGLIPKPNYCRCDVFNEKNLRCMDFPAYLQLKCDGSYREICVSDNGVEIHTRSGETDSNPVFEQVFKNAPKGYYLGEFTLGHADHPDADRSVSNGMLNSKNCDYSKIVFTVWDYLTDAEYTLQKNTIYAERFENLKRCIPEHKQVDIVPCIMVYSVTDAIDKASEYMNKGLEGGVLKSQNMTFKNGTSKQQLKIKLRVEVEMRCIGFIKGNTGTKYHNKNKVIVFSNNEKTVYGRCSGMSDEMIRMVTDNPEMYIGKIFTVEFNDLTKAENNDYYALSHPRFICWRDDKSEPDTFEKCKELRDSARMLRGV